MELELAILPDGRIRVRVPDGQAGVTFEVARAKIQALQTLLGVEIPDIVWEGTIEQHTHGPETGHSHTHLNAR